jgi:hypothetical protein
MEEICSSETTVDTQRTTRRYIPEDGTLHNHRCENLRSYKHEQYFEMTTKIPALSVTVNEYCDHGGQSLFFFFLGLLGLGPLAYSTSESIFENVNVLHMYE